MLFSCARLNAQMWTRYGVKIGVGLSDIAITDRHLQLQGWTSEAVDYVHGGAINPAFSIFADAYCFESLNVELELTFLRAGAE